MQAQDLFPQVQRLVLTEQLTLLNFLVQLIQREVLSPQPGNLTLEASEVGLAKPLETETTARPTVLERMGGMPKYMLSDGRLSNRDTRRVSITDQIRR